MLLRLQNAAVNAKHRRIHGERYMPTNGEKYITGIPAGGTASFTVYFQNPPFDLLIINLTASLSKAVYFDM